MRMKTWDCSCGNTLFLENTLCLSCQAPVGWCPACQGISPLVTLENGLYACANQSCNTLLKPCYNNAVEQVCNRMTFAPPPGALLLLCDCCQYNRVIPDLAVPQNRQYWHALEKAKRRLMYSLAQLGLPCGPEGSAISLPLSFSFMADVLPDAGLWRSTSEVEKVYTGHDHGHITINLMESNDAVREKLRLDLNESHRTLIGHFRHEIGHYYWELLVLGRDEDSCAAVFGDHFSCDYPEALERYYLNGAPAGWQDNYVSAYASMHPWEDFAETFAFYLDIVSVLDTAGNLSITRSSHDGSLSGMIKAFRRVGLALNEINREMGLLDLVPEAITPAIEKKLQYIHTLVSSEGNVAAFSQGEY